MLLRMAQYVRNNRGQSLVEFSIIVPVFILLLVGMIDFGRVLQNYLVLTEAAQQGARAAVVGGSDSVVTSTAITAASSVGTGNNLTVVINPSPARTSGSSVTVTVTNKVTISSPIAVFFSANPYPVQGMAVMRVE